MPVWLWIVNNTQAMHGSIGNTSTFFNKWRQRLAVNLCKTMMISSRLWCSLSMWCPCNLKICASFIETMKMLIKRPDTFQSFLNDYRVFEIFPISEHWFHYNYCCRNMFRKLKLKDYKLKQKDSIHIIILCLLLTQMRR